MAWHCGVILRYQEKAFQGYYFARWSSPTLRWTLNGAIPTEHSNEDSLSRLDRKERNTTTTNTVTWHRPNPVQLRWHLTLGMLKNKRPVAFICPSNFSFFFELGLQAQRNVIVREVRNRITDEARSWTSPTPSPSRVALSHYSMRAP
jgi:hypothetical protein